MLIIDYTAWLEWAEKWELTLHLLPVCRARLSSIILSKMVRARTKVSFIETRSADPDMRRTYPEEDAHGEPALFELVDVADDPGPDRHAARRAEGLDDAPKHERRHLVRHRDAHGTDAEAW